MTERYVVDTDIIIDYLRDRPEAGAFIEGGTRRSHLISTASIVELYAGVRDGSETTRLEAALAGFTQVSIDAEIARTAGPIRRRYGKSHNTGVIDAMIAATARLAMAAVATLNRKHFPMVDVATPYAKN